MPRDVGFHARLIMTVVLLTGVHLVVTGDYFQLSPIPADPPAFEVPVWPELATVELTNNHRIVATDSRFRTLLASVRVGTASNDAVWQLICSRHVSRMSDTPELAPAVLHIFCRRRCCHQRRRDDNACVLLTVHSSTIVPSHSLCVSSRQEWVRGLFVFGLLQQKALPGTTGPCRDVRHDCAASWPCRIQSTQHCATAETGGRDNGPRHPGGCVAEAGVCRRLLCERRCARVFHRGQRNGLLNRTHVCHGEAVQGWIDRSRAYAYHRMRRTITRRCQSPRDHYFLHAATTVLEVSDDRNYTIRGNNVPLLVPRRCLQYHSVCRVWQDAGRRHRSASGGYAPVGWGPR